MVDLSVAASLERLCSGDRASVGDLPYMTMEGVDDDGVVADGMCVLYGVMAGDDAISIGSADEEG